MAERVWERIDPPFETAPVTLPGEVAPRRLRRRAIQVAVVLAVLVLAALLAPGLGEVRDRLAGTDPRWLVLAVVLEVLSCLSYVLMFGPIFCGRMSARSSAELALSELAVGALVPAGGAGGLALGAWALRRAGMPAQRIATRSVAFFLIKSSVNFVAVAVIGLAIGIGLAGPSLSPALTLLPAGLAALTIAAAIAIALVRRESWSWSGAHGGRWQRAARRALGALTDGSREATAILRRGELPVVVGSFGYWAFDNVMLWACFRALGSGAMPALGIILLGYLLGQLGGLLPLPGGIGGVDGGLVGALVLYGAPLASATAAVLLYRLIVFWVPVLMGAPAFASLQRGLNRPDRPDLCAPARPAPAAPSS